MPRSSRRRGLHPQLTLDLASTHDRAVNWFDSDGINTYALRDPRTAAHGLVEAQAVLTLVLRILDAVGTQPSAPSLSSRPRTRNSRDAAPRLGRRSADGDGRRPRARRTPGGRSGPVGHGRLAGPARARGQRDQRRRARLPRGRGPRRPARRRPRAAVARVSLADSCDATDDGKKSGGRHQFTSYRSKFTR